MSVERKQPPATSRANAEVAEARRWSRQRTLSFVSSYGIPMTLLLFIVVFSALRPDTFLTTGNFQAIIGTQAVLMTLALAVTIPLAAGDFDLSIGNVTGFTMAALTVLSVTHGWSWPLAFAAAIGLGLVVGAVNGFIIVQLGVNAFIVTLGTGTVLSGLTLAITAGETIGGLPPAVESISRTSILGVPLVAYYAFVLALILWYVLEHTPAGRYVLFVNGGRDAARLAGVPVARVRFMAFVLSAGICGIAGVLNAGQLGAADPNLGPNYLLPAYAAAFLGATTIKPGRFNAWGTVLALYTLAVGITGLQLLGAPFWVEPVFNGVALTLAVTVARLASGERAD